MKASRLRISPHEGLIYMILIYMMLLCQPTYSMAAFLWAYAGYADIIALTELPRTILTSLLILLTSLISSPLFYFLAGYYSRDIDYICHVVYYHAILLLMILIQHDIYYWRLVALCHKSI